jgi:class 3 adenylate cyclase
MPVASDGPDPYKEVSGSGEDDRSARSFQPGGLSLRGKIISPYIILSVIVTLVAAYIISLVVISNLEERFENQLLTTGSEAADAVVRYERQQLAAWRLFAFTRGVSEAVSNGELENLRALVEPIFVSESVHRLDVIDGDGRSLLVMDQADPELDSDQDYAQWAIVKAALAGPERRHAGLRSVGDEVFLYTAGVLPPTTSDARPGVLLVGIPLSQVAANLRREVLAAGVTLYSLDGQLLETTVGGSAPQDLLLGEDLATETLETQGSGGPLRVLMVAGDEYAQVLTMFEVQGGLDVGILGISMPLSFVTSTLYPTRNVLVVIFSLTLIGIVVIGYLLAASIGRPIERLTQMSRQVARGDLSVQVSASSTDEIGQLTRSFNQMVFQLRQRKYIEDLFGRYVGDEIAERILAGEVELGGQRIEATVLFADIRDFSDLSEKADLDVLIQDMNEYYTLMQEAIEQNGGVINKFGGDSLLALFGAPLPLDGHPRLAVDAALAMLEQLDLMNQRRLEKGEMPIRIGIGVHTGEMIVGNMGSERRREYTAMGDAVNIAFRLSELNRESRWTVIFISADTQAHLGDLGGLQIDALGDFAVRGRKEHINVFAINKYRTTEPIA